MTLDRRGRQVPDRTAERRAAQAGSMAKTRAAKKAKVPPECRQCSRPAARAPDGRAMSACNEHLDADAERAKNKRIARKAKS